MLAANLSVFTALSRHKL